MTTVHHRCRPPGSINNASTAFALISGAIRHPLRAETIVLALDHYRCGRALITVTGTTGPDDVIDVVERLAGQADHGVGSLVVASVRPPDWSALADTRADLDRWWEMSDVVEGVGLELLDWFVIGRSITRPSDAAGERPRW